MSVALRKCVLMVRHHVQSQTFSLLDCSVKQGDVLVPERFTSQAAPSSLKSCIQSDSLSCPSAVSLLIGSAMRSLPVVLVVLALLSYVPSGKMETPPCGIMNSEGKEGVRCSESEKQDLEEKKTETGREVSTDGCSGLFQGMERRC